MIYVAQFFIRVKWHSIVVHKQFLEKYGAEKAIKYIIEAVHNDIVYLTLYCPRGLMSIVLNNGTPIG